MAAHLRVHTTLVSQIFRGTRELSPEQAFALTEFIELSGPAADYFRALVDCQRTTSPGLRAAIQRRLSALRVEQEKIASHIGSTTVLSGEDQARFYSTWQYSGVRLATDIPELRSAEAIAARLRLSTERVAELLEQLEMLGLVARKDGCYRLGAARTHVGRESPHAIAHHRNWRLKAMECHGEPARDDLAFTGPMVIAAQDFVKIRRLLLDAIKDIDGLVRASPSETLACVAIDLFRL
jgi:uncharacterized protein (TIGR02147 family)